MNSISLYIDIAFCAIVLPLLMIAFPVERWWATAPVYFCLFVLWLYVTYFLYKRFIVPNLFHGKRSRVLALSAILVSLAVTAYFSSFEITSPFYHLRQQQLQTVSIPVWGARPNQQAVWLHYIIVVTFCFAVGMVSEAYRQRLAREEMEFERNRAELALYKAQMNPHFLFNTLNTLYGLVITRSDKAEPAMERFINLTKYMYNNTNSDFISLREEVDYIEQYIGLQKLRLNDFAKVEFVHDIEDGSLEVPPMMLITFVENAFKYGISSVESCFINIRLRQNGGSVEFEVDNSVVQNNRKESKRMGIANCRRRLELLYPGRHTLTVGKDIGGTTFCVRLELEVKEL